MSKIKQFLLLALLWIITYVIFHYVGWALYAFAELQWHMGNKGLLKVLVHILQFPAPLSTGGVSIYDQPYMELLLIIYAFVLAIGAHVLILKKLKSRRHFKAKLADS